MTGTTCELLLGKDRFTAKRVAKADPDEVQYLAEDALRFLMERAPSGGPEFWNRNEPEEVA